VAGVEADIGRVQHERVIDESPVARGVGHHQGILAENGVAAEGNTARRLACLKPYAGLEPLSVLVDEADKHSVHMSQVLGEPHQGIEVKLGWRIDQVHVIERALAKRFVSGKRASGHPWFSSPWLVAFAPDGCMYSICQSKHSIGDGEKPRVTGLAGHFLPSV